MKNQDWYHPVTVVSRKKLLQTFANRRDRKAALPKLRGAKIIDFDNWKFPRIGFRMFYIDRIEVFYTTRDIQKVFDIDKATVYKWQKAGLIPPPIFVKENRYGKFTKYYIRPQLSVSVKIVNDLRRQGLLKFTKTKIADHVAMVAIGNKLALQTWHERRERSVIKKAKGKRGVTWVEP